MAELDHLDPQKRIASLFLLPDCDMACSFCASEQDFSVMSFEAAESLLRALVVSPIRNVVLGGGEPFLWPHDVVRLSRLARELGFLVQVSTNGVALPAGFERIPSIDRYILPLEAMDPEVHDRLRLYRRGHHAIVIERMTALIAARRELTISTVVTRENIDQLAGIARYLASLWRGGAALHAWHLYRFLPVGRGGRRSAEQLAVPKETFLRACENARKPDLGFPVYRRNHMLSSRTVEYFWFERGQLRIGSEASLRVIR